MVILVLECVENASEYAINIAVTSGSKLKRFSFAKILSSGLNMMALLDPTIF